MKLNITFSMGNAAFGPDWEPEAAATLVKIATRVVDQQYKRDPITGDIGPHVIADTNGNKIGEWSIKQ
jgi:hypothetical protein